MPRQDEIIQEKKDLENKGFLQGLILRGQQEMEKSTRRHRRTTNEGEDAVGMLPVTKVSLHCCHICLRCPQPGHLVVGKPLTLICL
jgi:hypothetical protein